MTLALVVLAGYLLGSIPFAWMVGRAAGVDIRHVGSGNVGATNVLRATRVPTAAAAVILDVAKGSLAVWMGGHAGDGARVAAGAAAIVGHVFPVWLRFRGGKGVATAVGVFTVLAPGATGAAVAVFVAAAWLTRFVSLGSLLGAATLAACAAWRPGGRVAALAVAVAALVTWRHRENLARLRDRTERRLGERV